MQSNRFAVAAAAAVMCLSVNAQPDFSKISMFEVDEVRSLYRNVRVIEGGGLRCITFGRRGNMQTCIDPKQPKKMVLDYTKALMTAFYMRPEPQRVLVVGLGGGVLPLAIQQAFPGAHIDVVEIDPAVARSAVAHFGFVENTQLSLSVQDGRVFVRQQRRKGVKYDTVLLDAFEQSNVPDHMTTKEFLQELRDILTADGVIAANSFKGTPLVPFENATYQAVFGTIYQSGTESGNRIIYSRMGGMPPTVDLANRAKALNVQFNEFAISPGSMVAAIGVVEQQKGVSPLTDQFSPGNLLLSLRQ